MISKALTLIVFLLLVLATFALAFGINRQVIPPSGLPSVWLYSGLIVLIFAMFYVEPYYTAPKNVLAHALAVTLVLLSVQSEIEPNTAVFTWWQVLGFYSGTLILISWTAIVLPDSRRSDDYLPNRLAEFLKSVAVLFGNARVLYSGVFLLFLPVLHSLDNQFVIATLVFWWLLVMTNPQRRLADALTRMRTRSGELAELFSVQSDNIFLAKAYENAPPVATREPVLFQYGIERPEHATRQGMVVATYLLDDAKWLKILSLGSADSASRRDKAVWSAHGAADASLQQLVKRVLGVVCEQSDIRRIRFDVVPGGRDIEEGELVEVAVGNRRIFYQITNGITEKEMLEAKNESGFIRGEAVQLGQWNQEVGTFERFGWLPDMNAAVLRAESDISVGQIVEPEFRLGRLPNMNVDFPINVEHARSHHLALLGITGAGKSFVALKIIQQMTKSAKVICVDFTGEYKAELAALEPAELIDPAGVLTVEENLAKKHDEQTAKGGSKEEAIKYRKRVEQTLDERVEAFLTNDPNIAILELPDMSNSAFIIEFTQMFLNSVFQFAKKNPGQKICLVIEEAHTVIPETTSLGDMGDYGSTKALVNKIGQIALQGRKYGIGFLIIAQRTANVSKTVLTQCNSLICFQAFDETSFRFLENHLGKEMTAAVPKLKKYHAVVVGKAFRGNMPMIVDLTQE